MTRTYRGKALHSTRSLLAWITLGALGATLQPVCAQTAEPAPRREANRRETSFPVIPSTAWSGPRLRDGQPDVEGHWSNTIGNHGNFTDPQGGQPGGRQAANVKGGA